jgi:hypothetical protein
MFVKTINTTKHLTAHNKKKRKLAKLSDFTDLWKNYDITIKTIREKAWK